MDESAYTTGQTQSTGSSVLFPAERCSPIVSFRLECFLQVEDTGFEHVDLLNIKPLAQRIITLRRQRLTGKHIAIETGVSPATVSRVLKRAGLSRLKDIEAAAPTVRYEYTHPGGLIHLDIKRLGRFERVGHRITGDRTGQSLRRQP